MPQAFIDLLLPELKQLAKLEHLELTARDQKINLQRCSFLFRIDYSVSSCPTSNGCGDMKPVSTGTSCKRKQTRQCHLCQNKMGLPKRLCISYSESWGTLLLHQLHTYSLMTCMVHEDLRTGTVCSNLVDTASKEWVLWQLRQTGVCLPYLAVWQLQAQVGSRLEGDSHANYLTLAHVAQHHFQLRAQLLLLLQEHVPTVATTSCELQ